MRTGLALIPADRPNNGSVVSLPVDENVALPVLGRYFKNVALDRRHMRRATGALIRDFDVRPNDPSLLYGALSGGNQQKALLAKWFQTDPRLLLLHEPTQGVDVGARQEIYRLVRAATQERGIHVLCASSDYEQLAKLCDRVIVFARSRVHRELVGAEVTKERIIEQCYAAVAADVAGVVTYAPRAGRPSPPPAGGGRSRRISSSATRCSPSGRPPASSSGSSAPTRS
jgi:ribose transport system ATP-binding protein